MASKKKSGDSPPILQSTEMVVINDIKLEPEVISDDEMQMDVKPQTNRVNTK